MNYFHQNTPTNFKSHLNSPIILNGIWRVALVEVNISSSISKSNDIYLHYDICDDSIVNGNRKPLLRRLMTVETGNWSAILETPHYVPVKLSEIDNIGIYITDDHGGLVSFLDYPSTVTLHFKAFPFL